MNLQSEHTCCGFTEPRHDTILPSISSLLKENSFSELAGSHQYSFTYHHPSLPQCKSWIDCIYFNFPVPKLWGCVRHVSFSDCYLVEAYRLPDADSGPRLWWLPSDMLSNQTFIDYMNCQFQLFDECNPVDTWERIKLRAQLKVQTLSKYQIRQFKNELSGLHSNLRYINRHIFQGETLECHRLIIQTRIEQHQDQMEFFGYETNDFKWILN